MKSNAELPTVEPPVSAQPTASEAPPAAWYMLAVFTLVYVFAIVDRQIVTLLAEPLRKSLELSDTQLGVVMGTSAVIFGGLAMYPVAWLADRFDRRWVLAGCVLVWSAGVVACGLASDFWHLVAATAAVGAAEAGLSPIAVAMIPSMFGPGKRQLANSLFALAAMSGGGLGIAAAGQIVGLAEALRPLLPAALAALEGWRLSFFIAAAPAPLFVLLVLSIRLPGRGGAALLPSLQATGLRAAAALLPHVRQHRQTFLTFFGGQACYTLGFGALTMWLPVILMRHMGQTAEQVGLAAGIVYPLSTAVGFLITVLGMKRLTQRFGESVPIRMLWLGCAVGVMNGFFLVFANSAMQIYVLATLTFTFQMAANMTYPTALQNLAPGPLRARAAALQGIMVTPIGAVATPAVGFVSDLLGDVPHGLQIASAMVGVPALLLGLFLFTLAARPFAKTAAATRAADAAAAAA